MILTFLFLPQYLTEIIKLQAHKRAQNRFLA